MSGSVAGVVVWFMGNIKANEVPRYITYLYPCLTAGMGSKTTAAPCWEARRRYKREVTGPDLPTGQGGQNAADHQRGRELGHAQEGAAQDEQQHRRQGGEDEAGVDQSGGPRHQRGLRRLEVHVPDEAQVVEGGQCA